MTKSKSDDTTKPLKTPDTTTASWALEADRVAIADPLVECLVLLAGHYGRRTSHSSLTAGLPVPKSGITPLLFERAALRCNMHSRLSERSLGSLAITPNLPTILVLKEGQACIVWNIRYPKDMAKKNQNSKADVQIDPQTSFQIQFPETEGEKKWISIDQLQALYTGYAFFLRPIAKLDDRIGPAEIDVNRRWFWDALKKNIGIYKEVVLAAILINCFALVSPLFTMNVYDRVIPNSAFDTLWVLAVGVVTVYSFDFILKQLRAHFLDVAGHKADVEISAQLYEQMMGMTMTSRPAGAGTLVSHMKDFEGLRDFFTSATIIAFIDLPFVLLFIFVIYVIGGAVAFAPLLAIPLVVVVGLILQKPLLRVIQDSMNESAQKSAQLFETITGLETIKVQASEGHVQRKWEELTNKASRTSVKSRRLSAFMMNYTAWIQQLTNVLLIIIGVWLISEGEITMGALIACVMISGRIMAPLSQVAGLMTRLRQSTESLRHLDALMKKEVERPMGKHFISKPDLKGRIEFRDVVFHYPQQSIPALKNISFTIEPGDKIAIIGAVGSGKTTIERLMLNLYQPDSGSVQIDGTDVRQIDPGDLRRSLGTVQQSPQLFYGSVRENITMGHETALESAIMEAAELSGTMEFLRESEHGLDTQVGERGESLSGGQRQAVAIARSLLYDPPIMIFDEPTASMDPASENRLLKRLIKLCENKTTIVITHKAPMLAMVNKIILLDRGKLIAYGPKEEVIKKLQGKNYEAAK